MMLRILTMADVPADPDRGAAGTELRTVEALRALGHEVDSVWNDTLGRRIGHGNLHLLLELPRAYERAAVDALQRKHYDVVHVNQPHGFRAARAVHRLSPRTAFIHRSHGLEPNVEATLAPWRERFGSDERNRIRRGLSRALAPLLARHSSAIAREADGHVVSSSLDRDFLAARLRVNPEKIAVIPQAPAETFLAAPAPPMTPDRLRRVLYVGQFAFVKAPMIVAHAMNALAAAPTDVELTWICESAHHAQVRELLSQRANARVDLQPWMRQEELRDAYDRCGVFLFPSFFEGFGKTFLEAMSRGLCVIGSDVGGMHDVIQHGRTGMLVPPGDAAALADVAQAMMNDQARAVAMSAAAVAAAREYTWERVAREIADFYRARIEARR